MALTIARRFQGPPESGNGGWVSGAVASFVPTTAQAPAVTVRLASPPPLEEPLDVRLADGGVRIVDGDQLIATGSASADLTGPVPGPVSFAAAQGAEAAYEGLVDHPFPDCFVCGTGRDPADALCLRPGPVGDGSGRYAASWVPAEVTPEIVWAALDCPGGWSAGIAGRPMVLGTMTARILTLPQVGLPHVVVGWERGGQGRKYLSGTALFTEHGELLARAEATWIAVDPESVRPVRRSQ